MTPVLSRTLRTLSVSACLFAGSAVSALAAEYFVGPNGTNTNNPGTNPATPLATITHALTLATSAGDIVTVQAGTYRGENAVFKANGVSGNPITLRAAPGETVTVKGSIEIPSSNWSLDTGSIYKTAWSHYFGAWDPIHLTNPNPPYYKDGRTKGRNQLFVDGQIIKEVASKAQMTAGSFFIDNSVPSARVLYAWLADGTNPATKNLVEGTVTQNALLNTDGKDHLVIKDLNFEHCANPGSEFGAVRIREDGSGSSTYVTLDNVSVSWASGSGLAIRGAYHTVLSCTLNNNAQNGLHISGANSVIVTDTVWMHNNKHPNKKFDEGTEASMKLASSRNCVFDNIEAAHNQGAGWWVDGSYNQNNVLKNSRIHHNTWQGVRVEICFTTTVSNNLVYENGAGGIVVSAALGNRILNNTIYRNGDEAVSVAGDDTRSTGGGQMSSYSNVVLNNIAVDNQLTNYKKSWNVSKFAPDYSGNLPANPYYPNPDVPYAANISENNLFFISANHPYRNSPFFKSGGGDTNVLRVYQDYSGMDLNSLWSDPRFINAAAGDFRLQNDSLARGLGSAAALPEVASDIDGVVRDTTFIDLGAHQLPRTAGWLAINATADAGVSNGSYADSPSGTGSTMNVETKGGSTYRKGYIRFPVSSLASEAILELTTQEWSTTASHLFRLYGLENGDVGDGATDWIEGVVTYNTAPANATGSAYFVTSTTPGVTSASLLETFPVQLATTGTATNTQVNVSGTLLRNFINSDTNGHVTLLLARETLSSANTRFYTRETTVSGASGPRLLINPAVSEPDADTYTHDGTSTTNYGTALNMFLKTASGTGYNRRGFLKFDVTGESDEPSATLRLLVERVEPTVGPSTPVTLDLYRVTSDSWDETTLMWSTPNPTLGVKIGSVTVTHAGQLLVFDLGTYVQNETDGVLSLALVPAGTTGRGIYVHSREATLPSTRPTLAFD